MFGKVQAIFQADTMENDSRKGLGLLKLSEQKQSVFVTVNHPVSGSSPTRGATSNQSVPDTSVTL